MTHFNLRPEDAHPNARVLLRDDFYWSAIEETAPFGNEEGVDAFDSFVEWRNTHKDVTPVAFYEFLISEWHYPRFDWNEMDVKKIEEYMNAHRVGNMMLVGLDNAIIAIGFGQYILEGKIDESLRIGVKSAIERQLLPVLLSQFAEGYRPTRKEQLQKMLEVIEYMNNKLRIA